MSTQKALRNVQTQQNIEYARKWNRQLLKLMGAYSSNMTNARQFKGLTNFNRVIYYVQDDRQNRVCVKLIEGEETIDYTLMMEFDEVADQFRELFGTKPIEQGQTQPPRKVSYLELRSIVMPNPEEDRVYVGRQFPVKHAWKNKPDWYVAKRIGFEREQQTMTDQGLMTVKVPMFARTEMDKKSSNCIPYEYWQREKQELLNILFPVVSILETIIAQHLHNEGHRYERSSSIGTMDDREWSDTEDADNQQLEQDTEFDGEQDGLNE